MKIHSIAFVLLVIGGLNWLLESFGYGLGGWGLPDMVVKIIYILVGLSAIYEIATHKQNCKHCEAKMPA
jgi:uncharacterized membrane protein YuzA (DUF378 family)